MKKYLKIGNAGQITKDQIELLGFSAKRGDNRTIGEKGTGLKFSRIQAVRKGLDFIVCTHEFKNVLRPKRGSNRLVFEYDNWEGKKNITDSSYTVDAGFSDWTSDWFIVREVIQNARDENLLQLGLENPMETTLESLSVVSTIERPKKGESIVYLELTNEIAKVFENLSDYFVDDSVFMHPNSGNSMRVFLSGIFVGKINCEKSYSNVNLKKLELTESRDIKYSFQVHEGFYREMSKQPVSTIRKFLRYAHKNPDSYELDSYTDLNYYIGDSFLDAFKMEFGDNVCIHSSNGISEYKKDVLEGKNMSMVYLGSVLYKFFKDKGVLTFDEISNQTSHGYKVISADTSVHRDFIHKCFSFFGTSKLHIYDHTDENVLGFEKDGEVFINRSVIGSDLFEQVLVEELIHAKSGEADYTRGFQTFSCKAICKLINN